MEQREKRGGRRGGRPMAWWVGAGVLLGLGAGVTMALVRGGGLGGAGGSARPGGGVAGGGVAGGGGSAAAADRRSAGGGEAASRRAEQPGVGAYARFFVPEFSLVDTRGRVVTQEVFEGRHTVLQFFFTACPGPCPATSKILQGVQERARGTGLQLVSISVDGGRDTVEAVRAYAAGWGAEEERWRFLTGPVEDVQGLLREGLGYTLRRDQNDLVTGRDGERFANILHPTQVMLIGPDRRVIDLAVYTDEAGVERVVAEGLRRAGG